MLTDLCRTIQHTLPLFAAEYKCGSPGLQSFLAQREKHLRAHFPHGRRFPKARLRITLSAQSLALVFINRNRRLTAWIAGSASFCPCFALDGWREAAQELEKHKAEPGSCAHAQWRRSAQICQYLKSWLCVRAKQATILLSSASIIKLNLIPVIVWEIKARAGKKT